ncbi:phosphatase PAP2 family protein [Halorussus salilacus]|uniref:phosphatase PAP2 family protein n=1 Tax=Halorussus salilacus TaxID=2953750 RepID=UPI0020A135A0|nr:phosphatase PAP2 family protein [Halorussus salilacus]USZ69362.1 phosphatase PAP2 family protein [Halorussus salilacus]
MLPVRIIAQVLFVVFALIAVASPVFVGLARLSRIPATARQRLRAVGPYVAVLVALLAVNSVVRDLGPEFSWIVGYNVTGIIHAIEGQFVAHLQSTLASPMLTAYFSYVYVYGYAFLLIFPVVAYFALEDTEPLRQTIVAYSLNYGIGVLCYLAFIAYGPRNLMPEMVEGLLFTTYPEYKLLTAEVNSNTNVFPSLHTSLSVTVALLAARTREVYRGWFYVATLLAASITFSTMYLGIHWGTDVIAGILVAVGSVRYAESPRFEFDRF